MVVILSEAKDPGFARNETILQFLILGSFRASVVLALLKAES
jgi:hypothetical protein